MSLFSRLEVAFERLPAVHDGYTTHTLYLCGVTLTDDREASQQRSCVVLSHQYYKQPLQ